MLTTEAKAQENWCPMVRIARRETFEVRRPAVGGMEVVHTEQFIPGGCNTDALGRNRVPASCRCIGSGCMMWRWGEASPPPAAADTRKGYCGLAGLPFGVAQRTEVL